MEEEEGLALIQQELVGLDEKPWVGVEAVLAEHCSLEAGEVEVMFLASLAVTVEVPTEYYAQEVEEGRARDLEVEVEPLRARDCL